jgi:hypothetical protein
MVRNLPQHLIDSLPGKIVLDFRSIYSPTCQDSAANHGRFGCRIVNAQGGIKRK